MTIDDYFSGLERGLTHNVRIGSPEEPILCLASDEYNGLVRCRIYFYDASYLDVYEVVNTELGYPVKIHYSYTYIRDEKRIFRYDNAPHHPEIETFPHHKHSGERDTLSAAPEPNLARILAEIGAILQE
ncbi:MAG: hypothetical protein HY741_00830 [Chloroflexi bacterium]|nr:hypothetical protein [Chloroflexota bacterium]